MKIMHDVLKMCGWKYLQEESNLWYDRYSKKISLIKMDNR